MPELVADDLRVGRLVALALRLGAHRDDGLAGQVHLDVGRLPHRGAPALADRADPLRGRDAADLDVGRQPDAEVLAARPRVRLGLRDPGVAGHRQRLVHRRLVVARVDVDLGAARRGPEPGRVLVRELVGLDEVPPPELGAVHPDLGREQVHRPLDDVGRLGPAGAAVGVDEHRVRVDAGHLGVDVRDLVAARQDAGVERRRDARADGREAAAEVGQGLDPEARDLAVARARDLEVGDVVAAVDRALVVLAPALDPLDRPAAERLAGEQHHRVVGVAEDLGPEGAADVRADAPDLVLRDAHDEGRQQQPLDVRRLARHPDRVLVGARVVPADVAADLHRVRDQALVDDPLADDDLGARRRRRPCRPCRRRSTRRRRCSGRSRGAAARPAPSPSRRRRPRAAAPSRRRSRRARRTPAPPCRRRPRRRPRRST